MKRVSFGKTGALLLVRNGIVYSRRSLKGYYYFNQSQNWNFVSKMSTIPSDTSSSSATTLPNSNDMDVSNNNEDKNNNNENSNKKKTAKPKPDFAENLIKFKLKQSEYSNYTFYMLGITDEALTNPNSTSVPNQLFLFTNLIDSISPKMVASPFFRSGLLQKLIPWFFAHPLSFLHLPLTLILGRHSVNVGSLTPITQSLPIIAPQLTSKLSEDGKATNNKTASVSGIELNMKVHQFVAMINGIIQFLETKEQQQQKKDVKTTDNKEEKRVVFVHGIQDLELLKKNQSFTGFKVRSVRYEDVYKGKFPEAVEDIVEGIEKIRKAHNQSLIQSNNNPYQALFNLVKDKVNNIQQTPKEVTTNEKDKGKEKETLKEELNKQDNKGNKNEQHKNDIETEKEKQVLTKEEEDKVKLLNEQEQQLNKEEVAKLEGKTLTTDTNPNNNPNSNPQDDHEKNKDQEAVAKAKDEDEWRDQQKTLSKYKTSIAKKKIPSVY